MTPAGFDRVKACFENMEEIFPANAPRREKKDKRSTVLKSLPQMPQLPQQCSTACKALSDEEDAFEERAAIIEYDGGFPRAMAEFLASK